MKNGDGAADIKSIAHLYKTEVYGMARYLGLPAASPPRPNGHFQPSAGQDVILFA